MKKLLPWLWEHLDWWVFWLLTVTFFLILLGSEFSQPHFLKPGGSDSWILRNENQDTAICLVNGLVGLVTMVIGLLMIAFFNLLFFGFFLKLGVLGTTIWLIGGCSHKYFYSEASTQ